MFVPLLGASFPVRPGASFRCVSAVNPHNEAQDTQLRLRPHTVAMLRNGRLDPTIICEANALWRASLTPVGAGAVVIYNWRTRQPTVESFGPGGQWLAERAADILGCSDQHPSIIAAHPEVKRAQQRFSSLQLPRTHTAYHELIPAVLGQRVTGIEAFRQWRDLCHTYGSPAPGPRSDLWLPPDPDVLSRAPYFELHQFGIEKKRADTLRRVASHVDRLMTLNASVRQPGELTAALTNIPGVGDWTAATAGGVAFGDPDALLVGDFHIKNNVAYALSRQTRGTDAQMIQLLAPYAGQRARVVKWLELDGWFAPKFGHKQRIQSIMNR
jgi:3-methyladenine DNA glycosylase/8-oxoguanine DNA glycosylase